MAKSILKSVEKKLQTGELANYSASIQWLLANTTTASPAVQTAVWAHVMLDLNRNFYLDYFEVAAFKLLIKKAIANPDFLSEAISQGTVEQLIALLPVFRLAGTGDTCHHGCYNYYFAIGTTPLIASYLSLGLGSTISTATLDYLNRFANYMMEPREQDLAQTSHEADYNRNGSVEWDEIVRYLREANLRVNQGLMPLSRLHDLYDEALGLVSSQDYPRLLAFYLMLRGNSGWVPDLDSGNKILADITSRLEATHWEPIPFADLPAAYADYDFNENSLLDMADLEVLTDVIHSIPATVVSFEAHVDEDRNDHFPSVNRKAIISGQVRNLSEGDQVILTINYPSMDSVEIDITDLLADDGSFSYSDPNVLYSFGYATYAVSVVNSLGETESSEIFTIAPPEGPASVEDVYYFMGDGQLVIIVDLNHFDPTTQRLQWQFRDQDYAYDIPLSNITLHGEKQRAVLFFSGITIHYTFDDCFMAIVDKLTGEELAAKEFELIMHTDPSPEVSIGGFDLAWDGQNAVLSGRIDGYFPLRDKVVLYTPDNPEGIPITNTEYFDIKNGKINFEVPPSTTYGYGLYRLAVLDDGGTEVHSREILVEEPVGEPRLQNIDIEVGSGGLVTFEAEIPNFNPLRQSLELEIPGVDTFDLSSDVAYHGDEYLEATLPLPPGVYDPCILRIVDKPAGSKDEKSGDKGEREYRFRLEVPEEFDPPVDPSVYVESVTAKSFPDGALTRLYIEGKVEGYDPDKHFVYVYYNGNGPYYALNTTTEEGRGISPDGTISFQTSRSGDRKVTVKVVNRLETGFPILHEKSAFIGIMTGPTIHQIDWDVRSGHRVSFEGAFIGWDNEIHEAEICIEDVCWPVTLKHVVATRWEFEAQDNTFELPDHLRNRYVDATLYVYDTSDGNRVVNQETFENIYSGIRRIEPGSVSYTVDGYNVTLTARLLGFKPYDPDDPRPNSLKIYTSDDPNALAVTWFNGIPHIQPDGTFTYTFEYQKPGDHYFKLSWEIRIPSSGPSLLGEWYVYDSAEIRNVEVERTNPEVFIEAYDRGRGEGNVITKVGRIRNWDPDLYVLGYDHYGWHDWSNHVDENGEFRATNEYEPPLPGHQAKGRLVLKDKATGKVLDFEGSCDFDESPTPALPIEGLQYRVYDGPDTHRMRLEGRVPDFDEWYYDLVLEYDDVVVPITSYVDDDGHFVLPNAGIPEGVHNIRIKLIEKFPDLNHVLVQNGFREPNEGFNVLTAVEFPDVVVGEIGDAAITGLNYTIAKAATSHPHLANATVTFTGTIQNFQDGQHELTIESLRMPPARIKTLSVNPVTGQFTLAVENLEAGTHDFTLKVTDGTRAQTLQELHVNGILVKPEENRMPLLDIYPANLLDPDLNTPELEIESGQTVVLSGLAADLDIDHRWSTPGPTEGEVIWHYLEDDEIVAWEWFARINDGPRFSLLSGTGPDIEDLTFDSAGINGEVTFYLKVTDGYDAVMEEFTVAIPGTNYDVYFTFFEAERSGDDLTFTTNIGYYNDNTDTLLLDLGDGNGYRPVPERAGDEFDGNPFELVQRSGNRFTILARNLPEGTYQCQMRVVNNAGFPLAQSQLITVEITAPADPIDFPSFTSSVDGLTATLRATIPDFDPSIHELKLQLGQTMAGRPVESLTDYVIEGDDIVFSRTLDPGTYFVNLQVRDKNFPDRVLASNNTSFTIRQPVTMFIRSWNQPRPNRLNWQVEVTGFDDALHAFLVDIGDGNGPQLLPYDRYGPRGELFTGETTLTVQPGTYPITFLVVEKENWNNVMAQVGRTIKIGPYFNSAIAQYSPIGTGSIRVAGHITGYVQGEHLVRVILTAQTAGAPNFSFSIDPIHYINGSGNFDFNYQLHFPNHDPWRYNLTIALVDYPLGFNVIDSVDQTFVIYNPLGGKK